MKTADQNSDASTKSKSFKSKTVEEKYEKKTPREHILDLPDTYIGSVELSKETRYVKSGNSMILKEVEFVPGLYKIFDEIVVNARDHKIRDSSLKNIKINVNKETGGISVWNDGVGIEIAIHKEYNVYVPELIFGHLLTSSNYDKDEKKITGGKNGYGAKLANIYSKKFIVETIDTSNKTKFYQEYYDNMSNKTDAKITKSSAKSYTKIEFFPDYERFGISGISDDIYDVFEKRIYDLAACTPKDVNVYFNNHLIEFNDFNKYVDLYLTNANMSISEEEEEDKPKIIKLHEIINDRWEVAICLSPLDGHFQQISFVNGIFTARGGKHVEYVVSQLTKKIGDIIHKKKKKTVKPVYIKDNLWVFINCIIENPSFDSQTKETLNTIPSKFGSKCDLSDKFIEKLCKIGIIERTVSLLEFKENKDLKKMDGKKKTDIRGIPKLDDANYAGTNQSHKCTLILTEGDSAKAFAISGLGVIGRDYYGVFPLRGKLRNVRDVGAKDLVKNVEINNLKKIIGLQQGKIYNSLNELRYGSVMILTDADVDGSHIKGLVINFFECFWPSLLNYQGFIKSLSTPVVKVSKGSKTISFFNLTEYQEWKDQNNDGKGWYNKYYKGLGTSTSAEAKEYFKDINNSEIKYVIDDKEECKKSIILAFDKKFADSRKTWLGNYEKNNIIHQTDKIVSLTDFVNKDLIHFSNSDNIRSIPNLCDGLKPSQRKVLYGCLKRNLTKEIKVSQLSGYVSEQTAYHHGEASLQGTIVSLAHDFIGSNNINLLNPNGQFGTRLSGGKDSASARYIFTNLNTLTQLIFHPDDLPILDNLYDDGVKIEPKYFVPVIPMILVNGTDGIGTGFSTSIPTYNPRNIIENLKNMMDGNEIEPMMPWFKGHDGNIIKLGPNSYISRGKYTFLDYNTIKITELPIGKWTDDYKEHLESCVYDPNDKSNSNSNSNKFLTNYENHGTESTIKFILKFRPGLLNQMRICLEKLEKKLKLTTHISSTNMHLHDENEMIKKYKSPEEILTNFYDVRLMYYHKRREYLLKKLKRELDIISSKVRFIEDIIEENIIIFRKKKDEVIKILKANKYPMFDLTVDVTHPNCDKEGNYNYLTGMQIHSFTLERIEELKKQKENKLAEVNDLESKTEKDIWKDDLDNLLTEYNKWMNKYYKNIDDERKSCSVGGLDSKKANKGKKKSKKNI